MIGDLHFLRPEWLWLLLPATVALLIHRRQRDQRRRWLRVIEPEEAEEVERVIAERTGLPVSSVYGGENNS